MDEFYTGKDVTVKFDTFSDGKPRKVNRAKVSVYGPEGFIGQAPAKINGSEVMYSLPGKEVEKPGEYSFVFDVVVAHEGKHTHVAKVTVKKLPVG